MPYDQTELLKTLRNYRNGQEIKKELSLSHQVERKTRASTLKSETRLKRQK